MYRWFWSVPKVVNLKVGGLCWWVVLVGELVLVLVGLVVHGGACAGAWCMGHVLVLVLLVVGCAGGGSKLVGFAGGFCWFGSRARFDIPTKLPTNSI